VESVSVEEGWCFFFPLYGLLRSILVSLFAVLSRSWSYTQYWSCCCFVFVLFFVAVVFSAMTRLSRVSREQKRAYGNDVIQSLQLDDVRDTLIANLSVGQKKRLTVAVELAANPSIRRFLGSSCFFVFVFCRAVC
jgi:ABC-type lipopolysaccharide export system ATPase subunit